MSQKKAIMVARGDGIGPEIMEATLRILEAAGAEIEPEFIDIGEKVYLAGNSAGIEPAAWHGPQRQYRHRGIDVRGDPRLGAGYHRAERS
ncbi:MAG: hypothetical protein ACOC0B_01670 [bacterium]